MKLSSLTNSLKIMLFGLVIGANPVHAELRLNDPIVDSSYALSYQEKLFSFDKDGVLASGPTRRKGEPVDYSSILKEVYMEGGFLWTLTECYALINYCTPLLRKYKSKDLYLKVLSEQDAISAKDLGDIEKVGKDTLIPLGFKIFLAPNTMDANLVIIAGSINDLTHEMQKREDLLARTAVEKWQSDEMTPYVFNGLFLARKNTPSFCYASTKDWAKRKKIWIYVSPSGIYQCLPQALLSAIGLYPTGLDIPSITDSSQKYKYPTFADLLFAKLLYDEKFPKQGGDDAVRKFWEQNVGSVWHQLVKDQLKDGPQPSKQQ
ncbi:hypothetical protein PsAD2_03211 [Pseudovibrio axinellae]|uniref:Uncharacterized protein n=1 Tax=Pseudovibrio axinellae TaxID=989403 RepID=A0A165X0C5_9HYPH|nr:hypothetical protein [Pseudovibrio axinellae]KZL17209.1 hypothetical protein PsAD2_03211 [Pseudovibrio axinellae]SER82138.1 hypothetical protein SAMN05421798_1292 [Pseudovibrio axinellae]